MKHGQAGIWDVDGSGLQRIEDQGLTGRICAKVNALNVRVVIVAGLLDSIFVVLPGIF